MNIVGYGGGTNSTAMLIGMHQRGIPVDLILFSGTGGEQPHTYEYLPLMNQWLVGHGMPSITVVEYTDQNGGRLTLEQECLRSGTLPAIAYGYMAHGILDARPKCQGVHASASTVRLMRGAATLPHVPPPTKVYRSKSPSFQSPLESWGFLKGGLVPL